MIFTTVALAGALGTGTLGIKVYREEKKKKEYPWTYAAQKMARKDLLARRGGGGRRLFFLPSRTNKKPSLLLDGVLAAPVSRRLSEGMLSSKVTLTRVKEQLVKPFAQGARHQQLDAFSSEDEAAGKRALGISPEEQQINRYMASGAIALGLSIGGYFMSPLTLLAAIPAFYSFLPVYPRAVKLLLKERRIGMDTLDVIYVTGAMATGNIFAVALGGTMYQFSRKLLIKTEHSSKENLADMFGSQSRDVCGI